MKRGDLMFRISPDMPCKGEKPEEEDLLGYYPFAETLAEGIYNCQPADGLVIALYGPWGTGKSTLLNFVQHALTKKEKPITIVRFNPWWFSGREDLSRDLIDQIGLAFSPDGNVCKKIRTLMHKYAEGIGRIADLTGVTAGCGKVFGKAISTIACPPDIPKLKTDISKLLAEHNGKILVMVDDIDRLNPDEIHELFTVIKALADFPNVIYLMAFDKEIVGSALTNKLNYKNVADGERFLQKIVQVEFVMPIIDKVKISNMLIGRLQEIVEETLYHEQNQEYWNEIYSDMKFLFESPRDVFRFTNAISVTYPAVKGEVNTVDFIAIEAIRIFIPTLYSKIKDYPDQFTKMEFRNTGQPDMDEEIKKTFEEDWVKSLPQKIRVNAQGLMRTIFPCLKGIHFNADDIKEWANEQRICHQEILPVYFKFALPDSMVPKSEIKRLFSCSSDKIASRLLQYKSASGNKLEQAIERLSQSLNDIPKDNVHSFVSAFFDIGDSLIEDSDLQWFFWKVRDLALEMLQLIGTGEYKDVLTKSIKEGRAFTIPILTISGLLLKQPKTLENSENVKVVSDDVKNILIESIREKITDTINNEPYWIPQCLPSVLSAWEILGGMAEAKEYCKRQIDSDENMLLFLRACGSESLVYGEKSLRSVRRVFNLDIEYLVRFIDFKQCVDRLKTIEKELSDEDKEILKTLESAIKTTTNK